MTLKRAAAYVRVSSEEQTEGWSLDGQEQQIREYAEKNGYEIVQVYRDETSGSKDKRPGFERMIMDAHAGLFTAVVVVNTSRFMRSVHLARRYKDMLRNKLNIEVLFVHQPVLDPKDPSAFMMEGINELFDEYYLHQLRFWTTLGKQTRAQRGLWNGTLPFGYMTDEDGVPVLHPENAEGVRLAFESYSSGRYSDAEIAEVLNREGYRTTGNWGERPFTKDTINRLLKNEFYLGLTKYKGETYPGQHPALIDKELFDRCQDVRSRRVRHRRSLGQKKRVYVLAGLVRCHECGLTLRSAATQSGGKWRYYRHMAKERGYECSVPRISARADALEGHWTEIVSAIQLPSGWRGRIEDLAEDTGQREAILRERAEVEEKLRRLRRLYQDLLIDDAEYRASYERLQARLTALVLPASTQLIQAGEYLQNLGMLWSAATLAEQRDITRVMIRAMYADVESAQLVSIAPLPVFRLLFTEVGRGLLVEVI